MKRPKISVCIPVRNSELWLAECIQSIIDQSFKDWEIIIHDDCSTDSSTMIIAHFKKILGDRLFISYGDTNRGIAYSRNLCNSNAHGEIICVQDSDDISHKDRLKNTRAFFKRHKNIDLVYGSCQYINALSKPFDMVKALPFDFETLKTHNYIQHPTVAYRRKAIIETPYRNECKVLDDWFLYLDFYKAGKKFGIMEDVLSFYRVLPTSVSRSPEKAEEVKEMRKKFLEEASAHSVPVGV